MHKLYKVTQRTSFNGCSSLHNGADLKLLAKFSQTHRTAVLACIGWRTVLCQQVVSSPTCLTAFGRCPSGKNVFPGCSEISCNNPALPPLLFSCFPSSLFLRLQLLSFQAISSSILPPVLPPILSNHVQHQGLLRRRVRPSGHWCPWVFFSFFFTHFP